MAHYETTIDSPLSAAAAFERLSDVTRFVEWDPGVLAAKQVEGNGPGPDAAYELSVKGFVGNSLDLRYDVVEFAEPSLLHLVAESPMLRSDDIITIVDTPSGSSVTYVADLDLTGPGGVLGVADPLLGLAFDKIGDRAAAGLRRFLDAD
ncbi:MAG: SRPBCC family protein [Acidimicrobiales bacterium]